MDAGFIVPVLALITLFAGIAFAIWTKESTEKARRDPNHPHSGLAADGPTYPQGKGPVATHSVAPADEPRRD
ncbi:hypothetical protein [Roseivivax isoporae]|uniref:Uncharacterized protein n=1 Tax=Roseivivax isoporae LMG 25204 TaxID=1449351 RepID=X7F4Q4_9RHOB|nr:hypothetical protein [Roseivivax isoporae]ETX27907.1 hypothetical protein RISW2_10585 [Roseivivax isoporae LMG 25204]